MERYRDRGVEGQVRTWQRGGVRCLCEGEVLRECGDVQRVGRAAGNIRFVLEIYPNLNQYIHIGRPCKASM